MGDAAHAALRSLLSPARLGDRQTRVALGHDAADALLDGGLPKGTLHEVFAQDASHGSAAIGFAAGLGVRLAEGKPLLWVRQDFAALEFGELHGVGLLELGLDPDSVILVRTADAAQVLKAAAEGLACAALGAVIAEIPSEPKILDLVASRKLGFAAAQKGVTAILIRLAAEPEASAAETRWVVRAAPSSMNETDDAWGTPAFDAALVRNRHGQTGTWVMEWNSDDGIFRKPGRTAHSRAVSAASSDRPAAAAHQVLRQTG
jgi:protein ImuA